MVEDLEAEVENEQDETRHQQLYLHRDPSETAFELEQPEVELESATAETEQAEAVLDEREDRQARLSEYR